MVNGNRSSGIGKEITRKFAAECARVVIADLNGNAAEVTAAELGGAGMDVTNEAWVESKRSVTRRPTVKPRRQLGNTADGMVGDAPDVTADSLNRRQRPGKAKQAGRLRSVNRPTHQIIHRSIIRWSSPRNPSNG